MIFIIIKNLKVYDPSIALLENERISKIEYLTQSI